MNRLTATLMGKTQKLSPSDKRYAQMVKLSQRPAFSTRNSQIVPDGGDQVLPGMKVLVQDADCATKKYSLAKPKDVPLAGSQLAKPQPSIVSFLAGDAPTQLVTSEQLRAEKFAFAMKKRAAHRRVHLEQGTQKTLYGLAARVAVANKRDRPFFTRGQKILYK